MVGLQEDTYQPSDCAKKQPEVKKFVDAVEVFILDIYLNKTVDMSQMYDPMWNLGLAFWKVGETCNF